jgi:hypothetical protein
MINNNPFERWFEQREPNGQMRCDNIYDALESIDSKEELYDFVESMMLVSWSEGVNRALAAIEE